MTCDEFQGRLSAYVDGEMSHWGRWKVQTHVRFCGDCAGMLRELAEVDNCIVACARAEPAPEYLTSAVMRRLPAMPLDTPRRGLRLTLATGLAVMVMQLIGVGGAYWWGFNRGADTRSLSVSGVGVPGNGPASVENVAPAADRQPRGLLDARPLDGMPEPTSLLTRQDERRKRARFEPGKQQTRFTIGTPVLQGAQ